MSLRGKVAKTMANAVRNHRLRIIEAVLWAAGSLAISAYLLNLAVAVAAQQSAIDAFRERPISVDSSLWSESRKKGYATALEQLGEHRAIGILSIPAIDLEVAIFDGTSARVLNLGIGRVVPAVHGNLALAGHRDGFFRGLKDVAVGDIVMVETASGEESYQISKIFVVNPEDVFVLEPTDELSLTLITCYPFYFLGSAPQRFIVRATRSKPVHSSTEEEVP